MQRQRIRNQITSYRPRFKSDEGAVAVEKEKEEEKKEFPLLEFDVVADAAGSVFAQYDNLDTKLLIVIYGPTQSRDFASIENQYQGQFYCNFEFAPYILDTRSTLNSEPNSKCKEKLKKKIEHNINCVFNFNILLCKYPKCNIDCFIYCLDYNDSMSNDNLLLSNCINSLSIALLDARIEMKDTITSVYCQCFKIENEYAFQIEPNLVDSGKEKKIDTKKSSLVSDMTICCANASAKISLIIMNGSLSNQETKKAIKKSVEKCQLIKYFIKQTMIDRFEKKLTN